MTTVRKKDIRVIRTYKTLQDALFELLKEHSFEEITVSDLCRKAAIRRATFYKHFSDKHEFLDVTIQQLQENFDRDYDKTNGGKNPQDYYIATLCNIMRFGDEHKALFDRIIFDSDKNSFTSVFSKKVMQAVELRAKELQDRGVSLAAPPDVMAAFFSGALVGICKWWYANREKKQITEKEFLDYARNMLSTSMPSMTNVR